MTTNGSVERISTTISNVESPLIAGNLSLEITERFGLREEAPLSIVLSETAATTCQDMYIDTFDVKTADFYEQRCGFIRCGEILNFPPGNGARIYLKKELSLTS